MKCIGYDVDQFIHICTDTNFNFHSTLTHTMATDFSFDLEKVKHVNNRTKLLIFGYIHEMEQTFSLIIPELVSVICILYYYHFEHFTLYGYKMCINEIGTIATSDEHVQKFTFNTVYGNVPINTVTECKKYRWKFKILSLPRNGIHIYIGIDSSNKLCINDDFTDPKHAAFKSEPWLIFGWGSSGYKYDQRHSIWWGENCKMKENDDIIMELDVNERSLAYTVNGEDQGVAFTNIDFKDKTYYLAITMAIGNVSIQGWFM